MKPLSSNPSTTKQTKRDAEILFSTKTVEIFISAKVTIKGLRM
jgi:hypothetical protein